MPNLTEQIEKEPPALDEALESRVSRPERSSSPAKWIALVLLLVVAAGGYALWSYYSVRETTDDAQIDGHVTPVSAKVGGRVVAVNFKENQYVEAGTLLVQIDPQDYQAALDRAVADVAVEREQAQSAGQDVPITSATSSGKLRAALAAETGARASLEAAQKEVDSARAQLTAAQARVREGQANHQKAARDLDRFKQLVEKDEISQQQYDSAVAAEAASRAAVDSAQASVAAAEVAIPVAESRVAQARATLAEAEANVQSAQTGPQEIASSKAQYSSAAAKIQRAQAVADQAKLNLGYTTLHAPVAGIISNKNVEVGQIVAPGQPLFALVPLEDIWVTAQFKETQLHYMRPGQRATISVDAYGGRKYQGHVESISAATGARFSLLPPENASGNYVKVVQRVPVRIYFEKGQDPDHLLRPGMSVEPTVMVK